MLWLERLLPAALPALCALALVATLVLLGLSDVLPPWPRLALPVLTVLLALGVLVHCLRRLRRPTEGEADRRLEQVGGLRHRPLAILGDRPAATDAAGMLLWQAHQRRVAAQVGRLRPGKPRPGLARRDPRALRIGLALALAASFVAAGPDALPRLRRAVLPSLPSAPPATPPQLQAWVTPPSYTGQAPRFLHEGGPGGETSPVPIPAGSKLTANLTGGTGEPSLVLDGTAQPFRALDAASWQAEAVVTQGSLLQVRRGLGTVASWPLRVIPDLPPTVAFAEPPGPGQVGGMQAQHIRLPWKAEDDYGVVSLRAELRLRDRAEAPPIVLPVPLSGAPRSPHGTVLQELTGHPWAGLPVVAVLVARDAPGQEGRSADSGFILPERPFTHPVARAVIAIRRQLSLTPDRKDEAARALSGLAAAPEAYEGSAGIALNLHAAASLLRRGRGTDTVEQAQQRLWELALALEENSSDRTARALEAARQAAREAMEQLKREDTPENRALLERRMAELREAIQRHMEALAEQARRENSELPFDPQAQQLTQRDLDRMTREAEQAAREGRKEDAERQMAELERMLEQLQNARPGQSDPRQAERRQRGQQQMSALQDMVQREGGLLDHSQSRAGPTGDPQRRPPSPRQPQPGGQPGTQPGTQPGAQQQADMAQRDGDQRAQRALRRALGELMQQFGDLAGEVPQPLSEADAAMREAGQALADGRDAAAGEAQQRAIDALQRGGREMGQQMARQFGVQPQPGDGQDGDDGPDGDQGRADAQNRDGEPGGMQQRDGQPPSRRRADRRDPLGRPLREGASGTEESGDTRVPDQMEQARTRALQDELRRRGAERTRPQQELDYIDRLLKPY